MRQSSFVLICLALAAPSSTLAEGISTESDVVGRYTFSLVSPSTPPRATFSNNSSDLYNVSAMGSFVVDGAGLITEGVRWTSRPISETPGIGINTRGLRHELIEESFTGTYTVSPDGTGVMTISLESPTPTWNLTPDKPWNAIFYEEDEETILFTLADGGRRLSLVDELVGTREDGRGGPVIRLPASTLLVGSAERVDDSESEELALLREEVAIIRAELETSRAQLCEVIRLLHVPQGQRSSDPGVTEDACGTSYAWNEDGSRLRSRR